MAEKFLSIFQLYNHIQMILKRRMKYKVYLTLLFQSDNKRRNKMSKGKASNEHKR